MLGCGDDGSDASTSDAAGPLPDGAVEGTIRFEGTVPKHPVPDNAGYRRDLLMVDDTTGGLQYAVVYLTPLKGLRPSNDAASTSPPDDPSTRIDQEDYLFQPAVTAVRVGQEVYFGNADPANHNIRASPRLRGNAFNIVTPPDGGYAKAFEPEPDGGPIRLACDIHSWMDGWIYVFDHPYFAVTDETGRFRIPNTPPGRYRLDVRQPDGRLRASGKIEILGGQSATAGVTFEQAHLGGHSQPTIMLRP